MESKEMIMPTQSLFRYYRAPIDQVFRLAATKACICCGRVRESSLLQNHSAQEPDRFVCLDCLSQKKHQVTSQDTELGIVENGILNVWDSKSDSFKPGRPPTTFRDDALQEICYTPMFEALQQCTYLTCCNDFMAYIGRWVPSDFMKRKPSDNGKSLFQQMTGDEQIEWIWDQSIKESRVDEWALGAWYYAFECLHCEKLRGYWDCD